MYFKTKIASLLISITSLKVINYSRSLLPIPIPFTSFHKWSLQNRYVIHIITDPTGRIYIKYYIPNWMPIRRFGSNRSPHTHTHRLNPFLYISLVNKSHNYHIKIIKVIKTSATRINYKEFILSYTEKNSWSNFTNS